MPPKWPREHHSILRARSSLRTLLRRVSLHHCLALPHLRSVATASHRRLSKRRSAAQPLPCLYGRNVRELLHGCPAPDEQLEAVDDAVSRSMSCISIRFSVSLQWQKYLAVKVIDGLISAWFLGYNRLSSDIPVHSWMTLLLLCRT